MDTELIELSNHITETPPSASNKTNFGGGLELLMNNNSAISLSENKVKNELDDLSTLENELNSLVLEPINNNTTPPPATTDFFSTKLQPVSNDSFKLEESGLNTPKLSDDTPRNTSTWDGYSKVTNAPVMPIAATTASSLTKEELVREKFKYLRKLEALDKKGVGLTKKYNMDSPLCEMQGEYEMILEEKSKQNSIKFQSNMMMAMINGIEFLNSKFDPFDIKLDGWSDQINENLSDYDDVFGELHEKYKNRASLAPELKLIFQLAGSGLMIHMTNTMFKSSMPGMDDILRQNPDLMKQFQNAAVKTMSESSPGFSNFVSGNMNVPPPAPSEDIYEGVGYRPGNNNMAKSSVYNNGNSRADMKGPSDIEEILSGLKTRTINAAELENNKNSNSVISLSDVKEFDNELMPKKSKRRPKSERNTVSLDI